MQHFDGGLDYRLQDLARPDGPALRFIDGYGDTLFNEMQVRAFIDELRDLRPRTQEADLTDHIDLLIDFAAREIPPHSRLLFIGD